MLFLRGLVVQQGDFEKLMLHKVIDHVRGLATTYHLSDLYYQRYFRAVKNLR
jgi:hypothetical protein